MSKKWHFHACDIRVVYEQRCAVEHCLLWRDLDNPRTNSATIDDIFNALETRYDGWANVDWEAEFNLAPLCLSAHGMEQLRSEPYWLVNKETGKVYDSDMYEMCAITGVDPVELAHACDTDVEWREKIDDAICRAMLDHDYLIEFRSEEDAKEWAAENVSKRQFRFESTGMYMRGRPVFKIFELDKAGRNWLFYGRMAFDKGASYDEKVQAVLLDEIRQEM